MAEAARQWSKPLLATAAIADRVPDLRPNVRSALTGFAALIERLRAQAAHQPPADLLEELIQAIDYEALLRQEGPEGADRWENVRELVASAANWSEVVPAGGRRGRHARSSASWPRPRSSARTTRSRAPRTA